MTYTEADMKTYFDGWFFSVDYERGMTITKPVPRDFIPDHRPRFETWETDEGRKNNGHRWTEEEDELLLQLRFGGMTYKEIGKRIGLSESSVQNRGWELMAQRGMTPPKPVRGPPPKHSIELENEIARRRRGGEGFPAIAKDVGLSREQACHLYRRWRLRQIREAA